MENEAAAVMENPFGFQAAWEQSDWVIKVVLFLMIYMSLASWYIIIMKTLDQRKLMAAAKDAEKKVWSAGSLSEGVAKLPKGDLFREVAEDALRAKEHHAGRLGDRMDLSSWVQMSSGRAIDSVSLNISTGLPFLATVGSTAPFIGLFGTVWGILKALLSIGVSGQASIDKVAGPVGEALIMTAIGLAVAVPAVWGFNALGRRNKELQAKLGDFASDLHAAIISGARMEQPAPAAAAPAAKK
jgi:biopolymer transport protein ExbB